MEKTPIYLDYNATTPLDPEVIEKVTESLRRDWANPSSSYERGQRTKDILGKARLSVSNVIGGPLEKSLCDKSLTFTSGGTEANALAIFSAVEFYRQRNSELNGSEESPHVVTTNIEHPAIEIPLKTMEKEGKICLNGLRSFKQKPSCNYKQPTILLLKLIFLILNIHLKFSYFKEEECTKKGFYSVNDEAFYSANLRCI